MNDQCLLDKCSMTSRYAGGQSVSICGDQALLLVPVFCNTPVKDSVFSIVESGINIDYPSPEFNGEWVVIAR